MNRWLTEGRLKVRKSRRELGSLDEIRVDNGGSRPDVRASGWAGGPNESGPAREVLLIAAQKRKKWVVGAPCPNRERPDVVEAFSDLDLLYSGWSSRLMLDPLADRLPGRSYLTACTLDATGRAAHELSGGREIELR